MKKTLEKILQKLGYKYLRYAIPYRFTCRREAKDKFSNLHAIGQLVRQNA